MNVKNREELLYALKQDPEVREFVQKTAGQLMAGFTANGASIGPERATMAVRGAQNLVLELAEAGWFGPALMP